MDGDYDGPGGLDNEDDLGLGLDQEEADFFEELNEEPEDEWDAEGSDFVKPFKSPFKIIWNW